MTLKASLQTLGCRLNQAETAIIAKSLTERGYEIVDIGQPANLAIINTCTVTEQADAKCRQAVRQTLKRNKDTFVAVIGCYAQMGVDVIKQIEGVDLIVGNEHKLRVVDYLNGLAKNDIPKIVHSPKLPTKEFTIDSVGLYTRTTRANLKIQDGCNYFCAFCIIPTARGRARSRKFADIILEAEKLVESGHQELVLTGVNIGTYKNDGKRVLDLIKELEKIDNLKRIRISSIEPTTIGKQLVEYMADSKKLCRYLHIPIQSGDNTILKSMKRRHTVEQFMKFVEWTAQTVPDIGLGTDLMVGFPGEGEQEFVNCKKALADSPISYFHVFSYSARKGTVSYQLSDNVEHHLKKLRTRIMIEMGERKKYAFYESHLGRVIDVLFETKEKDSWVGYTDNYLRVKVDSDLDLHNKIIPIQLQSIEEDKIVGVITS